MVELNITENIVKQEKKSKNGGENAPFEKIALSVNLNIFTIKNGQLCALLIQRKDEPYKNFWALPGGFVKNDETLEQCANRKLKEETNIALFDGYMEQLKTYGDVGRNPRQRAVSVAYVGLIPNLETPVAGNNTLAAKWWAVQDLKNEKILLGFDHEQILNDGLERVRAKLEYSTLALEFLEEPFTLSELYRVYVAVWGTQPDLGNFRRKVLSTTNFVTEAVGRSKTAKAGRPGKLYCGGTAKLMHPPMMRGE